MKQFTKTALTLAMSMMMAMPISSFAATNQSPDPIDNISSDTATITVGKNITVNQSGKFPNISDFTFSLEAVKAWRNDNVNAATNGTDIPVADMPMPNTSAELHHKVSVSGTTATVTAGDFKVTSSEGKPDTDKTKLRMTDINIKFDKAGYYMYRMSEVYDPAEAVPGVAYDDNNYYVVVYVCNRMDASGNTQDGVYVHDITSYRNDPESDVQPDLSDIANVTDNGGAQALDNIYENFAKVGKSENTEGTDEETGKATGPNKLNAYNFWNDQTTHDVVITNNVTGNLGDISKEFEFVVELTGLEKNVTYTTNIAAEDKDVQNMTSDGVEIIPSGVGSVPGGNSSFVSDADGNATFTIKLKDDEVFVMNALPATSTYKVTEKANDHIASYGISSTSEDTAVIENAEAANTADNTELATAVEVVDGVSNVEGMINSEDNDGTITIAFNNHRNLATITGLPYYGDGVWAMGFAALIGLAVLMVKRRRSERDYL